jgi:hypothetical protein
MSSDPTLPNGQASTALERTDPPGLDRLQRKPIIDTIEPRTLALIQNTIAPNCSPAEVGHFLELCAHYGLDPFAKEAWCAKGNNGGNLLIMVGRDGLRKVAQRNGLHVDGDVVRENDEFTICRTPDGNRTVTHSYGSPAKRGEIIGAWAECRMAGPMGRPMGYFYAPLNEYLPKNVSSYSPWSKQVGVMILAAAERQAIRQATPLGGLLAIGEDEVVNDHGPTVPEGGDPSGAELPHEVEHVLQMAAERGHAGLADRGAAELAIVGQPPETVEAWVATALDELEAMPPEAEVVQPAAVEDPPAEPQAEQPVVESLAAELHDLEADEALARADGDEERADELQGQADALKAHIAAVTNANQGSLL